MSTLEYQFRLPTSTCKFSRLKVAYQHCPMKQELHDTSRQELEVKHC